MSPMPEEPTSLTAGIDIGARSVKLAILSHREARFSVLATAAVRIPASCDIGSARAAMRNGWARVLADAELSARDVDYVASTGTRDHQAGCVGPFYGHLSRVVGGQFLFPDATATLDVGVRQIRCDLLTGPSNRHGEKTLDEPCAWSGSGFRPESLATKATALLRLLSVDGKVVLTGGMVGDAGFVQSLWSLLVTSESNVSLLISPQAAFVGAYGAAILAARRLAQMTRVSPAPRGHERFVN